jgi:hypothetical protein
VSDGRCCSEPPADRPWRHFVRLTVFGLKMFWWLELHELTLCRLQQIHCRLLHRPCSKSVRPSSAAFGHARPWRPRGSQEVFIFDVVLLVQPKCLQQMMGFDSLFGSKLSHPLLGCGDHAAESRPLSSTRVRCRTPLTGCLRFSRSFSIGSPAIATGFCSGAPCGSVGGCGRGYGHGWGHECCAACGQ